MATNKKSRNRNKTRGCYNNPMTNPKLTSTTTLNLFAIDRDQDWLWLSRPDDEHEQDFWQPISFEVNLDEPLAEQTQAELAKRDLWLQEFAELSRRTHVGYPNGDASPEFRQTIYAKALVWTKHNAPIKAGSILIIPVDFSDAQKIVQDKISPAYQDLMLICDPRTLARDFWVASNFEVKHAN